MAPLTPVLCADEPPQAGDGPPGETRRGFMRDMALGAVAWSGAGLAGCGGGGGGDEGGTPPVTFDHGVASGDPLADRVMLWTRVSTPAAELAVAWELAADADFAVVVAGGSTTTNAARDHTIKVDATGLQPGTRYWYRFKAGSATSPIGRTRTLPGAGVAQVRLAVFSCANLPAGYFNVYAEAAKRDDLDATVHLGDYVYEYSRDQYAPANAAALNRQVLPAVEAVSLADYRARHAQCKTDPDLQALHAAAPMIAVWDDHEVANNAYRSGAQNHQPLTEGDFAVRKAAAIQACHEWMPTRVAVAERIYRSFDFGSLLSLHMLDTRLIGRDAPLQLANYASAAGFDTAAYTAAANDPTRQLLGTEQTAWLHQQLGASVATWQVLGQQVLMGRMNIPAPIVAEFIRPGTGVTVSQYAAIAARAQADPASLTAAERALLAQPAVAYNPDAWDGYAAAREAVLAAARTRDKNLVVLAGDTHNAWASDLLDAAGNKVGVEFATASVSSPGFEALLPNENPGTLAAGLTELIGPLRYADTSRRGFLLLTASASACRADWVFVSTLSSRTYSASTGRSLQVLPGSGGRSIVEV